VDDLSFTDTVTLQITVPDEEHLIERVLEQLRSTYPNVAISVGVETGADDEWHVYRDGVPA
jgi:hypothetical protein